MFVYGSFLASWGEFYVSAGGIFFPGGSAKARDGNFRVTIGIHQGLVWSGSSDLITA